jgi:hypothetical protein
VTVAQRPGAQIQVVCFEHLGRLPLGAPDLGLVDVSDQPTDNTLSDLVLYREDVGQFAIVTLGPEVGSTACIDQLRRNTDAAAAFAHAPFDKVPDTQLPRYLPKVSVDAAIGECRVARGLSIPEMVKLYEALPLKEAVVEKWLYGNAKRFLRLH